MMIHILKKENKKLLVFLLVMITFCSCSGFLDEQLQGEYTKDTFFQNKEQATAAVTAIYEITAFKTINNALWVFGDVASDDAVKGGNPGDQSEIEFIDNFQTTSDNGYVEKLWQHYYEGISRANNCIANIPNINMDDTEKDQLIGEALFLRAFFYFHLVNIYGEVPLRLEPATTTDALHLPTTEVPAVWKQIKEDLEQAAEMLALETSDFGRATSGAANALLAKSYLFCEEWQLALDAIAKIEALDKYALMDVYSQNFMLDYENNRESLFEIQHLSDQTPYLGSMLNQWFSPQSENGYFFNVPTASVLSAYEQTAAGVTDPRLGYTIAQEGDTWINGEAFDPSWSPTELMQKKHIQPLSEVEKGRKGDGGLNYTFIRWAEVLLIKAEAMNELALAEAIIPLNKVRKRARESYLYDATLSTDAIVPEDLLPDVEAVGTELIREAIRHERRVELAFEFHRYYDLMRYGKITAEAALRDNGFSYTENRYFPIPQSEKDINNRID